jgi:hypothetical protein
MGTASADEQLKKSTMLLLRAGWKPGSTARNEAEQIYEKAPRTIRANSTFMKAFALNRIFHGKYDQAYEIVDELSRADNSDFDIWYLKAWLELSFGTVNRGMLTLQSIRKNLDGKKDLDEKTRTKTIMQLGRLIGFVESPANSKANPTTLDETIRALTTGLKPGELEKLNEQRKKIANDFNQYQKQKLVLKNTERAKKIQEQNAELQLIQNQTRMLENRAGQIEPKLLEIQQRFDERKIKLDDKASPLNSGLARTSSSISSMEQQLNVMYNDLLVTESIALRTRDVIARINLFNQADLISVNIRDQESRLAAAYADARGLSAELSAIQQEIRQNQIEYQQESGQLRGELNAIQRTLRNKTKQAVRLMKDPTVQSGRLLAIGNRAGALTTYDPLPLESLRQSLIDALEK